MDNKRLMIGMLIALAVLLGWNFFIMNMAKKNNWDMGQNQSQTKPEEVRRPSPGTQPTQVSEAAPGAVANVAGQVHIVAAEKATTNSLGSTRWSDSTWAIGLDTQSAGAAVSSVTLNQFPKDTERKDGPYVFQQAPAMSTPSMSTLWARINGQFLDLSRVEWSPMDKAADGSSVSYAIEFAGEAPVAKLIKTFTITPISGQPAGSDGYEVKVRHRIQNLSGAPINVQLGIGGPTTPPREIMRGPDLVVLGGYNRNPDTPTVAAIEPKAWPIESMTGEKQSVDMIIGDKNHPMIWAGQISTYFDALVFPVGTKNTATAEFLEAVQATSVMSDAGTPDHAELVFRTKPLQVAAAGTRDVDLLTFFGPKERSLVKNDYYGAYPFEYGVSLVPTGSCICTIQYVVDTMVWLLRGFHWVLRDWGLSIIALVILVRGLMHPLTRKSTESMFKMQKLAPEIERIKAKFKDDADEQQRAMMAFYKEHGAGQVLGCLPMFIQMPIWVALYSCLQSTFELRLAPFLWGYTWIHDLAKPDRLIPLPHIQFWFFSLDGINLLPILMGVFFFLQQKYSPKPASATPEQEQQQKMMQWMMVLMFPIMLYNGPSGLNLYIFTSTAVGMLESKWIKDRIKAREAAEAASGPVIIDAPATRGGKHRAGPGKPKGRIAQWMERVQQIAEDAQKQQKRKK